MLWFHYLYQITTCVKPDKYCLKTIHSDQGDGCEHEGLHSDLQICVKLITVGICNPCIPS